MTVVSKPVPTFKPSWLRKGDPSRGRRPKTPRTFRQLIAAWGAAPSPDPGYRRQPKGRRAKSGQWWRREPATLSDHLHRIIIDEAADPIPMDVLQRCDPRMAGGRVAWVGVDFAKDGSEQTVYRMPDGTIRVEPSRSNKP